jgi:hypothetical protein
METDAFEIRRSMIWNKPTLPFDDASSHRVVHYLTQRGLSLSQEHLISITNPYVNFL